MNTEDEILTIPEAAKLTKVSESSLYRFSERGDFKTLKAGKCRRVWRSVLLEWMEKAAA